MRRNFHDVAGNISDKTNTNRLFAQRARQQVGVMVVDPTDV